MNSTLDPGVEKEDNGKKYEDELAHYEGWHDLKPVPRVIESFPRDFCPRWMPHVQYRLHWSKWWKKSGRLGGRRCKYVVVVVGGTLWKRDRIEDWELESVNVFQ